MRHGAPPRRPGGLAVNFLFLIAGHGLYKVTALLALALLAHYLESAEFGRLSLAIAAVLLFETLMDSGVGQSLVRESAGRPDRTARYLGAALPLRIVLVALNVALAVVVITFTDPDPTIREVTVWIGLAQGFAAVSMLLRATFEAHERMEFVALSVAMEGLLRLVAIVGSLIGVFGLVGIGKALAMAELVVLAATALLVVRHFVPLESIRFRPSDAVSLLAAGMPMAVAWLLLSAEQRVNTLFLGRIGDETSVALFSSAARIIEVTIFVPSVLVVALFPTAVRHERSGSLELADLLSSSLKLMVTIAAALGIGLALLAEPIMVTVFGPPYGPAAAVLRVLAVAVPLLFVRACLIQVALVLNRWRLAVAAQAAALALDVALVAVLGGSGAPAAAVALLLSQLVAVAAIAWPVRGRFGNSGLLQALRPLGAAAVSTAAGAALLGVSPYVAVAGAAGAFIVGLRAWPIFTPAESAYVRSVSRVLGWMMSFAERRNPEGAIEATN